MIRQGSLPWLLHQQFRRLVRASSFDSFAAGVSVFVLPIIWLGMHAWGAVLGRQLREASPGWPDVLSPTSAFAADALLLLATGVALASALGAAMSGLFERPDNELLLAAPLPPSRIMLVRTLNIATAAAITIAFASPVIDGAAFTAGPRILIAYLALIGVCTLCSAAGAGIAVVLVAQLGRRRAKTVSVALSALAFSPLYFAIQVVGPQRSTLFGAVGPWLDGGAFAWAAGGLLGQWWPACVLACLGVPAMVAASHLLSHPYGRGQLETMRGRSVARMSGVVRFGFGIRAVTATSLRLLRRSPHLASSVGGLLPLLMGGVLVTTRGGGSPGMLPTFGVMLVLMIADKLLTITVNADQAAELALSSPVSHRTLRAARWCAALAVPTGVALMLAAALGARSMVAACVLPVVGAFGCMTRIGIAERARARQLPSSDGGITRPAVWLSLMHFIIFAGLAYAAASVLAD